MRQTRAPLLALGCLVIALVQAGCVEAYFRGWLNQDVGLGCFLAGGAGAAYMNVYGLTAQGGASPLGWVLLVWINAWVYHMIARLYLWAGRPGRRAARPSAAAAPLATGIRFASAAAS